MRDLDPKELLYLAAMTYSGFSSLVRAGIAPSPLTAAIERGLARPPVHGKWKLAWGPASFRARISLFDDSAMCVLRSTGERRRYVVAIRGTNPAAAFDWIFGDLWVSHLRPWPYGEHRSNAGISLSTAFGLIILQHLRADEPAERSLRHHLEAERDLVRHPSRLLDLPAITRTRISSVRAKLSEKLQSIEARRATPAPVEEKLHLLLEDWQSLQRHDALDLIRDAEDQFRTLGDRAHQGLFALLENEVELQNRLASGHDLLSFLRAAVREAGDRPVDVVVTGHSKGGALATAAALWLHETRGDGVAEEERWDPARQATVSCAAFAGPTAGNRGFAKRVEDKLGANYRRIANSLDIVPSAFVPEKLDRLARLYGPSVQSIAGMKQLAALIAAEIGPLEYAHAFPTPGKQFTEIAGEVEPSKRLYVEQAIYQHLDGYLAGVGLSPPMTAWTFFKPA